MVSMLFVTETAVSSLTMMGSVVVASGVEVFVCVGLEDAVLVADCADAMFAIQERSVIIATLIKKSDVFFVYIQTTEYYLT